VKVYYGVPLSGYTTFRIGGKAKVFFVAESERDIAGALKGFDGILVLGGGSNVLLPDDKVYEAVLHIGPDLGKIEIDGETVKAQAGARLAAIAGAAETAGLAGLEWAAHIPGTLGGALFMNAGAYGFDMAALTQSVTAAGRRDGGGAAVKKYASSECGFSYRKSAFQKTGDVITGATLKLKKGRAEEIRRLTKECLARRKASQPAERYSAGSVFKAAFGVPAAKYIDASGLKGFTIGGAQVSEKHANFIINNGNATYKNVLDLVEYIREKVYNAYHVRLETEIQIL